MSIGGSLNKLAAWDEKSAMHLLSRALFGFSKEDVQFALSMTIDEFVDNHLLQDISEPQAPGFWVSDTSSNNSNERTRELTYWWYNLMLTEGRSIREKMSLFWHNHFVSEIDTVRLPQRMYWQNKLLRENALGNFKDLTLKICTDPAMLIYLDSIKNSKADPNENFARELMELFTLGIGNYSETDIVEAAKALTGWEVDGLTAVFNPSRFDDGEKTFFAQTGNFNHEDIVNIIFEQEQTSKFLCKKLLKEFIYFEPEPTLVDELATVFRNNNYELKPVLSTILKSQLFYNPEIIGAKIKSPVEFIVTAVKQLNITNPDYSYMREIADDLGQVLYDPPNVAGWEGDKLWISTNTLPNRHIFTDRLVEGRMSGFSMLNFAKSFSTSEQADLFVAEIVKYFCQYELTQKRSDLLLEVLLDGAAVYDWSTNNQNAEDRLEAFFKKLMRLSEYQLA